MSGWFDTTDWIFIAAFVASCAGAIALVIYPRTKHDAWITKELRKQPQFYRYNQSPFWFDLGISAAPIVAIVLLIWWIV